MTADRQNAETTTPLVTVVMPTFNRAGWVGDALQSLAAQETGGEFDYEIVVVDNASQDNTRQVVEAFAAESPVSVRYLYSEPQGDAPTRNRGVREARGWWLAFFDDDQFAEPTWLAALLRAAEESGAVVVGGAVRLDLSNEQLERLGRGGRQALREVDCYDVLHRYDKKNLPGTGNALVARHVFDEVGLFDESLVAGGSDTAFFLAAREAGFELWYTPEAVIRHRIAPNRMTREFLRWDALGGGAVHAARFDLEEKGRLKLSLLATARIGQALLIHLPRLWWARVRGDAGEKLTRQLQLWRAEGYVRGTLRALLPRLCAQRRFFEDLDFRKGREIGAEAAASAAQEAAS